ncbi:MAG: hypothetical protein B7Z50_06235 [Sphingomonadales bacterium 12-62-5]|nr:MAG: hypothetical protein B7Z50_06235 [Sphingomonadales bacterium 12-62-5]
MRRTLSLMLLASDLATPPAMAADSLSLTDSFRIGTAGVLCTAQSQAADPALKGLFDRGYRIICRDAAAPVGALYALRSGAPALPAGCAVPVAATIAGLPGVQVSRCTRLCLGAGTWAAIAAG